MEQTTKVMPQQQQLHYPYPQRHCAGGDENYRKYENDDGVNCSPAGAADQEFDEDYEEKSTSQNVSTPMIGTTFWILSAAAILIALTGLVTVAIDNHFFSDNTNDVTDITATSDSSLFDNKLSRRLLQEPQNKKIYTSSKIRISVYGTSAEMYLSTEDKVHSSNIAVARKQYSDIEKGCSNLSNAMIQISSINYLLSESEQVLFVKNTCGEEAYQRVQELRFNNTSAVENDIMSKSNLAQWLSTITQWCAISSATNVENSDVDAVMFIDPTTPIVLNPARFSQSLIQYLNDHVIMTDKIEDDKGILPNVAVVGFEAYPNTIHSSFLILRRNKDNHELATKMLQLVLNRGDTFNALDLNSLLFSQTLHGLIHKSPNVEEDWYFLDQSCRAPPPRRFENEILTTVQHNMICPKESGYCCTIQDRRKGLNPFTVFMSRHLLLPYQVVSHDHVSTPYKRKVGKAKKKKTISNSVVSEDEFPFISTVTESIISKPANSQSTPTFYEMLEAKKCLPESDSCTRCLREKAGATCHSCGSYCHCYCKALCNPDVRPHTRFVAKKIFVSPPPFRRDPSRLIPRIVHQTWFEELSSSKYPNMSRMVQSFARSGWEYKFYTDDNAASFLETHFPPEVLEAYMTLRPGAFKADLFRYCVLLIHGGIYADVDIQLESALDLAIAPDIGFMVPIDEPGKPVHHQMCLWNGLIAAAPGHPFLAKAIETIVNQVRNRFTSVDIDETFCEYHEDKDKIKSPELSLLHAYDTLFTAGPCLLGSSINRVLGRPGQTSFHPGEVKGIWDSKNEMKLKQGTSFVLGIPDTANEEQQKQARVPGRTIILHQNKWDMGAHRFTFLEENLVIAATDLPDSNVKVDQLSATDTKAAKREHYSNTHAKTGVYGVNHLYSDRRIAHEDVRIFVDASVQTTKYLTSAAILATI